jgi:Protein of unknown function (DUF2848)
MTQTQTNLRFHQIEVDGHKKSLQLNAAYCIGYTGRNKEKTFLHIKELAGIGVPEPEEIPSLYPVRQSSLTQNGTLEVLGNQTSGEAEIVLIFGNKPEEIYVTVGSDHTDRSLETIDINKSKQVCDKPFAKKAWKLDRIVGHWDKLELSSRIYVNGKWEDYQQDTIESIIPLQEIKDYLSRKKVSFTNSIVFSGTVPLLDGFKYGEKFRMTFTDPVLEDKIVSEYEIVKIG